MFHRRKISTETTYLTASIGMINVGVKSRVLKALIFKYSDLKIFSFCETAIDAISKIFVSIYVSERDFTQI